MDPCQNIPERSRLLELKDEKVNYSAQRTKGTRKNKYGPFSTVLVLCSAAFLVLGLVTVVFTMIMTDDRAATVVSEARILDWERWKARGNNYDSIGGLLGHSALAPDNIAEKDTPNNKVSLSYLNHTSAFAALADNLEYSGDYFLLEQGLDAQENQAYCPVATSAAVLNSFRSSLELSVDPIYAPYHYATQNNVWNDCTSKKVIRHDESVDGVLRMPGGLGMAQTKALLECNLPDNFVVDMHRLYPHSISIDQMRHDLKTALASRDARVVINYNRVAVNQIGGGHWSPIGGYDEKIDSFLVMDVAKYKYPPVWVSADLLYVSLSTVDACGVWGFPSAVDRLPPNLQRPDSKEAYEQAMMDIGCEPSPRGYIIVREL